MPSLQETPRANRIHIAIFGRRNSGKSTLINAITNQNTAITSPIPGTTTDPVYKSMEINNLGPCVLIDTPGFDEENTNLGNQRLERTQEITKKADIAILVFADQDITAELTWAKSLQEKGLPLIPIINKSDLSKQKNLIEQITKYLNITPILISALEQKGIDTLIEALRQTIPDLHQPDIIAGMAKSGNLVLLVMPQDIQAPKGRLILPQVQVTRALLDKNCIIMSVTADSLDVALSSLNKAPDLIITDSQIFPLVYAKKPKESKLTSFSILMAAEKGDLGVFLEGANALDTLTETSHILIAEACTHAPLGEDIGRVKLPRLLRKKFGESLKIDIVSGTDFPSELGKYDLVIHCGACMFNRRYMLSRLDQATQAHVPMTNYGVALAKLAGILTQLDFPDRS